MTVNASSFDHAATELRALDPDRYAVSLVAPRDHRAAIQALFAFSAEIAAIRERVSEPAPGEIRLQWWVDAFEGEGHGAVLQNPVADALFQTLQTYELPGGPLVRLLAARRFDLYNDPMPDLSQFEGYAGETVSVLYQYAAMIVSRSPAEQAADAAGHLGVAQALAGHLRAFGYNASRGQLFLPLAVFTANGVREADIYAGQESAGLEAARTQLIEIARGHLDAARAAIAGLPREMRPVFSSVALTEADLKSAAKTDGSMYAPKPTPPLFGRLARVVLWAMRNA